MLRCGGRAPDTHAKQQPSGQHEQARMEEGDGEQETAGVRAAAGFVIGVDGQRVPRRQAESLQEISCVIVVVKFGHAAAYAGG
jgi:hypothetical protein